jgi:acetyltransferase
MDEKITLPTGKEVVLRKAKRDDLQKLIEMYLTLGEETLRFLRPYRFTAQEVKEMQERVDWKKVFSIVAENGDRIVGEARLIRYSDTAAEFGVIVHDRYQNMKLGQNMVVKIMDVAKGAGVKRLIGFCTVDNLIALHIYKKLGFKIEREFDASRSIFGREKGVLRLAIDLHES